MKKKKQFILIYLVLVIVFICIVCSSMIIFYNLHKGKETIQSGIYVKGINISGLTKSSANRLLDQKLNQELNDHLTLKYKDEEYYAEIEQFEAQFNIDSVVDFAYSIGRTGNFLKDIKDSVVVLFCNINIEPELIYNKDELEDYIENIESQLPDQLEQSSYYIDDDSVIVTNGKNGARIYKDKLAQTIIKQIQNVDFKDGYIDIPTYTEYPDPIDVEAIHDEVYREMKNAYFTTEPRMVYAQVTGVDFNVQAVKNAIKENPDVDEYIINLYYTKPEVTVDDLGMDAFPDLLGSFSTNYVNNPNRTTNLRLASNKINGTVIMPGDKFSFNKVVGKRTEAAGYKNAAIFSDGQVTDGLGGGICQVTSTLYNSAVFANMNITSRRNHMFVPSYVKGGRDATVVYGSTDFVFENSRSYPIKILSSVQNGVANVQIYGYKNPNEENYDISIETDLVKSTSTSTVYDAYKIYKKNGEVVKREKLSRDTYKKY